MTVVSQASEYSALGNGSLLAFATGIYAKDSSTIVVMLRNVSTGVETPQTIGTHYTLSNLDVAAGVTVTFVTAPASTRRVVVTRIVPYTQQLDISNQQAYFPNAIEDQFDTQELQIQQIAGQLGRTLQAPAGELIGKLPSVSLRANTVLLFDASGNPVPGPVASDIANAQANADRAEAFANESSKINWTTDLAGIKAFTGMANMQPALVTNKGMFSYSSSSTTTADDIDVIQPTTGGGRWLRQLASPFISNQITYRTMSQAVADASTLSAMAVASKPRLIKLLGGRIEGDGGACEVMLQTASGSETTVVNNGMNVAPGFEIILGGGGKLTWPHKRVNAIAAGMRDVNYATMEESITANDQFMLRADNMLDNNFELYFPQGIYWHRNNRLEVNDLDDVRLIGDGYGRTIFQQGDFFEVDGVTPKYDNGAGGPNPAIPATAAFQMLGGQRGRITGIEYKARWMRMRGFWMRQGFGKILDCKASQTNGRAFALSNDQEIDIGTLNGLLFNGEISGCIAEQSNGTAFSMYGVRRGLFANNRVQTCWAEASTTDASDQAVIRDCFFQDFCRLDDAAGTSIAGLYNGAAGNGGIGGIGAASCTAIAITNCVFDGCAQDNPTSTSRDKPMVTLRPNVVPFNGSNRVIGNAFLNGFVGVHIEQEYQAGGNGLNRGFIVADNAFAGILQNSGQGEVKCDEGCTNGVIANNTRNSGTFKIFGAYNVDITNQNGLIDDTTGHIHASVAIANNKG